MACRDGDIRLRGGTTKFEGRVELCLSERWGTVCDDYWDFREVLVVCRQLGFTTAGKFLYFHSTNSIFGGV